MFGAWRLLLALEVAAFHLLSLPFIGRYAVMSFFVLSGFLMTLIMHESYGYSWNGRKAFALNRFLRLYPSFWFAISVSLILLATIGGSAVSAYHPALAVPSSAKEWFENLSMIYLSWAPINVAPRLSPPTWALTTELFFYALICVGISRSKKLTLGWLALSAVFFVSAIALDWGRVAVYGALSGGSLPFAMGAAAYHYRSEISAFLDRLKLGVWIVFLARYVLIAIVMVFALAGINGYQFQEVGNQLNSAISALIVISLFNLKSGPTIKRWDQRLGDFSYPVYLLHWQAGAIVALGVFGAPIMGRNPEGLLVFALSLPVLFALSSVCVFLIDPWVNRARNRVRRKATSA